MRCPRNALRLVFRFRSSHHFGAPSSANFGIKGTLAISTLSSAAYGFEVPTRDCRELIGLQIRRTSIVRTARRDGRRMAALLRHLAEAPAPIADGCVPPPPRQASGPAMEATRRP